MKILSKIIFVFLVPMVLNTFNLYSIEINYKLHGEKIGTLFKKNLKLTKNQNEAKSFIYSLIIPFWSGWIKQFDFAIQQCLKDNNCSKALIILNTFLKPNPNKIIFVFDENIKCPISLFIQSVNSITQNQLKSTNYPAKEQLLLRLFIAKKLSQNIKSFLKNSN
ncbi:hypothetical protein ACFLYH_01465 [Candidatus Dependentiae bacterium]